SKNVDTSGVYSGKNKREDYMKTIDMVLATRYRFDKLLRMLKSVPPLRNLNIHVVFDGDHDGFVRFSRLPKDHYQGGTMTGYLIEEHSGSVHCRNHIFPQCEDGVLIACDDITFSKGAIESAFKNFNSRFKDGFGVVGFNQFNAVPPTDFCWTGVCLVGQKYLMSHPKKQLLNPEYFHFATREIEWKAKKLRVLYRDPDAKIFHYHPGRI
ncbi:unnamed protein product, partial [marine sediment metagenome]